MTSTKKYLSLLALLGASFMSWPARADVAPPDQCSASDEGKPCDNALSPADDLVPGTCRATTCKRATPSGSMTYDCFRCVANQGGEGGSTGTGGSGAQATGGSSVAGSSSTAGTSSSSGGKDDDGGCSVGTLGAASGAGGLMLVLGLLGASAYRRRSSKS